MANGWETNEPVVEPTPGPVVHEVLLSESLAYVGDEDEGEPAVWTNQDDTLSLIRRDKNGLPDTLVVVVTAG